MPISNGVNGVLGPGLPDSIHEESAMRKLNTIVAALVFGIGMLCGIGRRTVFPSESEFDRIRRAHGEHAHELFENVVQLGGGFPLRSAFARLWLNRELPEANRLLREAHQAIIKQEGGQDTMTA